MSISLFDISLLLLLITFLCPARSRTAEIDRSLKEGDLVLSRRMAGVNVDVGPILAADSVTDDISELHHILGCVLSL